MTTQHLEEAEELADQVALIDQGKLVQKGTVLDIKKKFGVGYNLTIYHQESQRRLIENKLTETIPNSIKDPTSTLTKSQFILPFAEIDNFHHFFEFLEWYNLKFSIK